MDKPSEYDILLEIKALLDRQVQQADDIQKESKEYLQKAEKRAQSNARLNIVGIVILIIFITVVVVLEAL